MSGPFDRALHRARLARAARRGGDHFLRARAEADLVERVDEINRDFEQALVIGGRLTSHDFARVQQVRNEDPLALDEEHLPFPPESFDLVLSVMTLHWVNDLVGALTQIRRSLRPGGVFIGAMLGGATLNELRGALTEAEVEITGGAGPRLSPTLDPADGGALITRAGFAEPVTDVDRVQVRYAHPLRLLADLRDMGETAALAERASRPLTRAVVARMCEIYTDRHIQDGKVVATFEIVTLTGWAQG